MALGLADERQRLFQHGERELIATRAPSATSSAAIARPMPFDAPVTSATRPAIPRSMRGTLT